MMLIMLTIETASIAIDQSFGHLHDPTVSTAAVVPMLVLTIVGVFFSSIFLLGVSSGGTAAGATRAA
jgi:hypothetical protein